MALTDKARLLKAIVYKADSYGFSRKHEKNENETFPSLLEKMIKYYDRKDLLTALIQKEKNGYPSGLSCFCNI